MLPCKVLCGADDHLVLEPIIDHLRLAMEDDKELEYSLKLCACLLLTAGFSSNKFENNPETGQQLVDFGEELMEFLARYQIAVIDNKQLTQELFNKTYKANIPAVRKNELKYRERLSNNFSSSGMLIENEGPLSDDVFTCMGFHEQLIGDQ